jgi:hypothetical protein
MSLIMMKEFLKKIHNNPLMADYNKCLQIREWRKEFVKEMNIAIELAENYRKELDKDKIIQILSSQEIELKSFFKEGLDLIDSFLTQYRISKEK